MQKEVVEEQHIWNFLYSVAFLVFVALLIQVLYKKLGGLPTSIPFFDAVLITLATFRLIRLFVYDRITKWFRDLFVGFSKGPLKTMSDLLGCPWCIGVWAGVVVSFFYFLSPMAWFFIFVLAVAGVATLLQLLSNMIGWRAEELKIEAQIKSGEREVTPTTCGVR